jgi:hypothetical protein
MPTPCGPMPAPCQPHANPNPMRDAPWHPLARPVYVSCWGEGGGGGYTKPVSLTIDVWPKPRLRWYRLTQELVSFDGGMEAIVQRALKKIKKETSRAHKALRESCNDVLGELLFFLRRLPSQKFLFTLRSKKKSRPTSVEGITRTVMLTSISYHSNWPASPSTRASYGYLCAPTLTNVLLPLSLQSALCAPSPVHALMSRYRC